MLHSIFILICCAVRQHLFNASHTVRQYSKWLGVDQGLSPLLVAKTCICSPLVVQWDLNRNHSFLSPLDYLLGGATYKPFVTKRGGKWAK